MPLPIRLGLVLILITSSVAFSIPHSYLSPSSLSPPPPSFSKAHLSPQTLTTTTTTMHPYPRSRTPTRTPTNLRAIRSGSSSSSSPSLSPSSSLSSKYQNHLTTSPLLTKSLTTGVITLLGDVIAQLISKSSNTISYRRLLSFFLSGTLFVGPFLSSWYSFLFSKIKIKPGEKTSKSYIAFIQVCVDQTVGVMLFFPAYMIVVDVITSLVNNKLTVPTLPLTIFASITKIKHTLPAILVQQYKIWPIFNFVNFAFVREEFRTVAANLASVVWNVYLCSVLAN